MKKVNVLGIDIFANSSEDFKEKITEGLLGETQLAVAKINTEFLTRAISNKEFAETLENSDINIPDGRGVLWAAKFLTLPLPNTRYKLLTTIFAIWQMIYSGAAIVLNPKFITHPIQENIPGVDALKLMLRSAIDTDSGVFFFGATQADLDGSIKNLKEEMPKLKVRGSLNGYDFQNNKSINPVELINKTDAKLLIAALGSPLQEYWIRDNMKKLKNIRVAVGEGGSLAFLGGTLKRAPKWAQKSGLEWLWRLFTNKSLTHQTGSRLKRVWNAVPVFICKVVKWKIRYGATEVE